MLVQLDYTLAFQAPFHFGTGIREGLTDRTVIRDSGNDLYVPASTFKGVLREYCEHLYHFYIRDGQESARGSSPHNARALLAEFGAPTLISQTFGSPLFPSPLLFSDARQSTGSRETYKAAQISLFTQVRIDRATGTAVDEALYTSQFGIRDLTFEGRIVGRLGSPALAELAENGLVPTYALVLLLSGLLMIERLGGNKSTGKGQCVCTVKRLELDGQVCAERVWQSWIERLDVLGNYPRLEKGVSS